MALTRDRRVQVEEGAHPGAETRVLHQLRQLDPGVHLIGRGIVGQLDPQVTDAIPQPRLPVWDSRSLTQSPVRRALSAMDRSPRIAPVASRSGPSAISCAARMPMATAMTVNQRPQMTSARMKHRVAR
jgi:hypothetical protein